MNSPDALTEEEQAEAANNLEQNKNRNFADGPNFGEPVSAINNGADLGHGDITGKTQETLTPEEQEKAAAKMEMKRQKNNQRSDKINEALGGLNTVKAIMNRKKTKKIQGEIKTMRTEKDKKIKKLKAIYENKKREKRELQNSFLTQILRIIGETATGIGIPVAIWEAFKLFRKNSAMVRLKNDMKKIIKQLKNTEIEHKKNEERKMTEIYNLQNIAQREAANEPMAEQRAA